MMTTMAIVAIGRADRNSGNGQGQDGAVEGARSVTVHGHKLFASERNTHAPGRRRLVDPPQRADDFPHRNDGQARNYETNESVVRARELTFCEP